MPTGVNMSDGQVELEPVPAEQKPSLAILTSLGRTEFLPRVVTSVQSLHLNFRVQWCPYLVDINQKVTIGMAWNECLKSVWDPESWVLILDDDNLVHPSLGHHLAEIIRVGPPDAQLY